MTRQNLIKSPHQLDSQILLNDLRSLGLLFYQGPHRFIPGYEHLFSNEFDWFRQKPPKIETDVVFGFGTNALWDISLRNRSKSIVLADWSPWPIIAQAFICRPLIKHAQTPQEFVLLSSGIPSGLANGLSLPAAFEYAEKFTRSKIIEQKLQVQEALHELASSSQISDLELRFLTTFFSPRLGINLNSANGFGPFPQLRNPEVANLTYCLSQRYHPDFIGTEETVFSSEENFQYLRSLALQDQIQFAVVDVMNLDFYKQIANWASEKRMTSFALALSNIFECGYYNHLLPKDLISLKQDLKNIFSGTSLHLYSTTRRDAPFEYQIEKLT